MAFLDEIFRFTKVVYCRAGAWVGTLSKVNLILTCFINVTAVTPPTALQGFHLFQCDQLLYLISVLHRGSDPSSKCFLQD